jgi:uncharacterized protein HemY
LLILIRMLNCWQEGKKCVVKLLAMISLPNFLLWMYVRSLICLCVVSVSVSFLFLLIFFLCCSLFSQCKAYWNGRKYKQVQKEAERKTRP